MLVDSAVEPFLTIMMLCGSPVLPADFSIYLHHPTITDPSMAPEGKSTFYALVPVAHMGKLAIDWEQVGPVLEKRILDEVGRRLVGVHRRSIGPHGREIGEHRRLVGPDRRQICGGRQINGSVGQGCGRGIGPPRVGIHSWRWWRLIGAVILRACPNGTQGHSQQGDCD